MYPALLIEDNPQVTFFFREVIAKHPHNMLTFEYAGDLKTGLDLINKNPYLLIVLDLRLPDSEEAENTILKVTEAAKDTAIVILTATEDEKIEDFAIFHGIEDYISKNLYDANSFFRTCRVAVNRKLSLIHKDVLQVKEKLTELLHNLEEYLGE